MDENYGVLGACKTHIKESTILLKLIGRWFEVPVIFPGPLSTRHNAVDKTGQDSYVPFATFGGMIGSQGELSCAQGAGSCIGYGQSELLVRAAEVCEGVLIALGCTSGRDHVEIQVLREQSQPRAERCVLQVGRIDVAQDCCEPAPGGISAQFGDGLPVVPFVLFSVG